MRTRETVPRSECADGPDAAGLQGPLGDERVAKTAHALAHPARLAVVRLLGEQDACVAGEIFEELDLAQSTVSEHLRVLREAEVVHATPVGTRMHYCLVPATLRRFVTEVATLGRVDAGAGSASTEEARDD